MKRNAVMFYLEIFNEARDIFMVAPDRFARVLLSCSPPAIPRWQVVPVFK
jgi:hypothetical protein